MTQNKVPSETTHTTAYCGRVSAADTPEIRRLWETCFEDSGAFTEWYFSHYYRPEHTLAVFHEDKTVASAQIIPYDINLRGSTVPVGYVVGVDTDPDYRHRGYAKTLLLESLKQMKDQRIPLCFLMPFEGRFYYRYGWQYVCFHEVARCKPEELSVVAEQWGRLEGIPAGAAKGMIPEMDRVYRIFTADYDGAVRRTPKKWEDTLTDMDMEHAVCYLMYHPETGELMGYFYYLALKNSRVGIPEIAWVNEQSRKALLWYLMDIVPADCTLELHLPGDDSLMYELATDKRGITMEPFVMARIPDVKQCLEQLCVGQKGQSIIMQVTDAFAEWNRGNYLLSWEESGAPTVLRGTDMPDAVAWQKPVDLTISVEGLALLVMGSRSVQQLVKSHMMQLHNPDALGIIREMFPETIVYFNEYY